ncbi:MAG TPA: HAMP domain-containing sensor histidine kinase [Gemmatimonadales bacterium]|nr:HAMP domain-containing sensor histidine kinase [Gemmatimonadales bacterium]
MKLPLLIGGLLVVAVAVYSSISYTAVRRTILGFAGTRLKEVTGQLAGLLRQSGTQLVSQTHAAADTAPITQFLAHPARGDRRGLAALLHPNTPAGKLVASAQLFDADRRLVFDTGDSVALRAATAATAELIGGLTAKDSGVVSRFLIAGDSVIYAGASPSVSEGRVVGYLVIWHYLSTSPQARQQMLQLIGAGAHLYLGDAGDNVWTDLGQVAPPPPIAVGADTNLLRYARPGPDGGAMIAVARPIRSAPWVVLVEFPLATVLAPAAVIVRNSLLWGAGILVLGLILAWWASQGVTAPLVRLTRTAEELAGRTSAPGHEHAGDEIERLATVFESMVAHVRESQRELEKRVKTRTTELQERNDELESFAYSISHDLRAPLRAMDGFSQALLEEYGDKLDATGRQYAERVKAGARRMDMLIRDLLAYSKMTRSDIKVGPVELDRVVRSAMDQVEGDARARGARVVVEDHMPSVLGHESTLTQVVMNLVANGIKFVPAGRTPEVRVRTERRDGVVRLWILDNGIGIPPEYHERIFRVFERLHRVDEYPGTGIGLAIVRKGVERMGGHVGLESEPDRGTSFWIDLPRVEAQARAAAAP